MGRRRVIMTKKEIEKHPILACFIYGIIGIFTGIWLRNILDGIWGSLIIIGSLGLIVWGIYSAVAENNNSNNSRKNRKNIYSKSHTSKSIPYINYRSKTNQKVINNSDKIKALIELNNQLSFKNCPSWYPHYYNCRSKRELDRMSTREYFYTCVSKNLNEYAKTIECIKYNRAEYDSYLSKIRTLKSTVTEELCKSLNISFKRFTKREQKLFHKLIHPGPVRYIDIYCKLTYTSPAGRNNYKKEDCFTFETLKDTYEKVKLQKTEQETKEYKAKQERSKMSASLRYDILKRDGFKCTLCGATADNGVTLHVDHIVPVAKGGKTEWSNLRTLCDRCNLGKSDKSEIQPPINAVDFFSNYENNRINYEGCLSKIAEYVSKKNFIEVKGLVIEQLNKFDDVKNASDKHFFILSTLEYIYPYRDDEACLDLIKNICDIDIANIHNLVLRMGKYFYMVTPTKRAILLERENQIERAIEICELCEKYEVLDSDNRFFSTRRAKLEGKLNKINKGNL